MSEIVFLSEFAGFNGGIERYIDNMAKLMQASGFRTRMVYLRKGRDFELFCRHFDAVEPYRDDFVPAPDAAVTVHKLADVEIVEKLLADFPDKLVLFVHDHDLYCPRRHKYYPYKRINCFRPYRYCFCSVCALCQNPKNIRWRQILLDFPRLLAAFRKFDRFVVLSDAMKNNLKINGFDPQKIHKIHPAQQIGPKTAKNNEIPQILFLGQLIKGKGGDMFINMLTKLKLPYRAKIVGDGNQRPELECLAAAAKLDHLEFIRWTNTPEELFAGADVVVLPFRWQEPFGLVGIEALANGAALAGFDIGGVGEYLIDNQTGFLVKHGDVDALAAKVDCLLADPALCRRFGDQGRELIAGEFSVELFVKKMKELFSCIC